MAQYRSTEIKVGIFVLVCMVMAAGMILKFGKYERLGKRTYEITVVFPQVGGIVRNASVMLAGIPVGRVRDIYLVEDHAVRAHVKLSIYEGVTIRNDAKFVINQSGLLGDRYIDVVPQSVRAVPLKAGDTVEGSSSVDLTEAIRGVVDVLQQAATTIQRVDRAIKRVDETVLNQESLDHVKLALANVDVTISNTAALALGLRTIVDENRGKVDTVLAKAAEASTSLSATAKRVDELVLNNQDDVRTATKNLAESTHRLNTLLEKVEKGEGTVGKLMVDPALHNEVLRLVQNWRRYGMLYKEPASRENRFDEPRRGTVPVPARPATKGSTATSGEDQTKGAK
jgi:phospholipid/cholesterol/gamma-HCH transport system substrate-binding protein